MLPRLAGFRVAAGTCPRAAPLALLLVAGAAVAQDGRRDAGQDADGGARPAVERLADWPDLAHAARARDDLARLRKAATPTMAEQAHTALVQAGAGAAPMLIRALERERGEAARERLTAALDALVGAAHTRLLAEHFDARSPHLRRWALRRAAAHPDPGLREVTEAALAQLLARREKARKPQEVDPEDLYCLALCVTSTGSTAGLDLVFERARSDWKGHRVELRTAFEALRGPTASAVLLVRLAEPGREGRIAALRVLAGCGDASTVRAVAAYLDSSDNSLRIEAINALRGIVDGDPPLERLAVFEAIEVAQRWKERL